MQFLRLPIVLKLSYNSTLPIKYVAQGDINYMYYEELMQKEENFVRLIFKMSKQMAKIILGLKHFIVGFT